MTLKPIREAREEMTAAKATAEHADFMKHAGQILVIGMKLKKAIQRRGLVNAKAECPICAEAARTGFLHGRLAGTKSHLRMWCDGPGCTVQMME